MIKNSLQISASPISYHISFSTALELGKDKEQSKLTAVQVQRLNQIDFEWDTSNEFWERGFRAVFRAVKEFRVEKGYCLLSIVDNKIVKRGCNGFVFWNCEQYILYINKKGNAKEECKLTGMQVRSLNEIDFEWDHTMEVQNWYGTPHI
eukprot:scaffold73889_cov66-Attheya_sp.AAC.1